MKIYFQETAETDHLADFENRNNTLRRVLRVLLYITFEFQFLPDVVDVLQCYMRTVTMQRLGHKSRFSADGHYVRSLLCRVVVSNPAKNVAYICHCQ